MKINISANNQKVSENGKKVVAFIGGYMGARIVTKALHNVVPVPDKFLQKVLYSGGMMVVEGYLGKILGDYIYEEINNAGN